MKTLPLPPINRDHLNAGWRTRTRTKDDGTVETFRIRAKPFRNFAPAPADGVAVHETALYVVGGTAERNAEYYAAPHGPQASVHAFVDDVGIWQSLEWHEQGWHAGDGMRGRGNTRFIAIEVCTRGDIPKAYAHAVALVRWLRSEGHAGDALAQHHDFSGKNCPRLLRHALGDLSQVEPNGERRAYATRLEAQLVKRGWDWDHLRALVNAGGASVPVPTAPAPAVPAAPAASPSPTTPPASPPSPVPAPDSEVAEHVREVSTALVAVGEPLANLADALAGLGGALDAERGA